MSDSVKDVMSRNWENEFKDIVEPLAMPSDVEKAIVNKSVWRLTEAATYMSRFLQYDLCGHRQWLPLEVQETLEHVAVLARTISIAMEGLEKELQTEGGLTACLECVEDNAFGKEGGVAE